MHRYVHLHLLSLVSADVLVRDSSFYGRHIFQGVVQADADGHMTPAKLPQHYL